jgi:lipopolysaccharide/colanic/teichoic acid biosynthesis glycosyltransferase
LKCYIIGEKDIFKKYMDEIHEVSEGKVIVSGWIEKNNDLKLIINKSKNNRVALVVADYMLLNTFERTMNSSSDIKTISVIPITSMIEQWLKRIPIEIVEYFDEYYETVFNERESQNRLSRIFDVIMSLLVGIILFPIFLLAIVLVFITSGSPVFFSHMRIGLHEVPFKFYKVRSLKKIDNKHIEKLVNPNGTIEERVTIVGKIIRKLRIDEIPQIYNIINGSMSLVGPRPEMMTYYKQYRNQIKYYKYRSNIKPGITGWAQINFNHTSTLEEYMRKTEYDLYYLKNQNFFLDLQIILMTIETMIGMKGSR